MRLVSACCSSVLCFSLRRKVSLLQWLLLCPVLQCCSSSLNTLTDGLLVFTCFSSLPVWDPCGSWMMVCCVYDWERLELSNVAAKPGWATVAAQVVDRACAWARPAQYTALPSALWPDLLLHSQLLVITQASQTQTAVHNFQNKSGSDFRFTLR